VGRVVNKNDPMATVLDAATFYTERDMSTVPIKLGTKHPPMEKWQNLKLTKADLPKHFSNGAGVGVLLGAPSKGLIDIDLDCPESRKLAPAFMPPTDAKFGRPGSPHSHWLYRCDPAPDSVDLGDPERAPDAIAKGKAKAKEPEKDRSVLVELRSTGQQTVLPPTIHPSGETITWDDAGLGAEPAQVTGDDLVSRVHILAAASLLLRYYPTTGARNKFTMALAGALANNGWAHEQARAFISPIAQAASDEELADRMRAVSSTFQKHDADKPIAGLSKLVDYIPAKVVEKIREWLNLTQAGDRYFEKGGCIYMTVTVAKKEVPKRLTTFTARIIADIDVDDGSGEIENSYEIGATHADQRKQFVVPADEFKAMLWVAKLGGKAFVEPGSGMQDHARGAIQHLSDDPLPRRTVYTHTGWRKVDGKWVYLHGGGAIGADGVMDGIEVRLPTRLAQMKLPAPPTGDALKEAVAASLRLLKVAPDTVTIPLIGAVYRAPHGDTDYTLYVAGKSGVGKTELVARGQQHFGAGFDRAHLPSSFQDTSNFVNQLTFVAKDMFMVDDDFAPGGTAVDVQRTHRAAADIVRGAGNQTGRGRLRTDGTPREPKPSRTLLAMTGEDVVAGYSNQARLFVVQMSERREGMLGAIEDGARGLYAAAMAGYIHWLAQDYEGNRKRLQELQAAKRTEAGAVAAGQVDSQHPRTPGVVGSLQAGFMFFTLFAVSVGALTNKEKAARDARAWAVLNGGAEEQAASQREEEPCQRYFDLLGAAITSGRAHVASVKDDGLPENPHVWGWQLRSGYMEEGIWEPRGAKVGWVDGADLYLHPDTSYKAAMDAGAGLTVTAETLRHRLDDGGFLVTKTDDAKNRKTVRKTIGVQRLRVLHVQTRHVVEIVEKAPQKHRPAPVSGPLGT
jgi:hypothetical protein